MMIQLIKDLGFEPPLEISQHQGTTGATAATLHDEKLNDIYQGYAVMLENREKLRIKIDEVVAQDAEILCAAEKKKSSIKEQSGPQQKKESNRRAKKRGNPWDRPKKRQQQPNIKKERISTSPLSNEIVGSGDAV